MWDLWWTKWHWNRYLSVYFGFLLLVLLHQCFLLIFICMLLLAGQTGEAWKASQKQSAFENRGALDRKFLSHFFMSFRELKVSEDHYCAVYTKTYASDAVRLYGGCVRNFYTPPRWITPSTFVPLHPLVVSHFCAHSGRGGWMRGPVWTWWRREKSFPLPGIEHMSPCIPVINTEWQIPSVA
jgi:hypothetical protein